MLLEDRYEDIDVPECERDADGYRIDSDTNDYQVPDGSEMCFAYLDDVYDSTESTWDDMSLDCVEQGFNLEFKIAVRPTDRIYEGRYIASCLLDVESGACGS